MTHCTCLHLQVYHDGRWGHICPYGWDINDARVVCSQLGYNNASYASSQYGFRVGPYWLQNLNCNGNESSVTNCAGFNWTNGTTSCSRYDGATIRCAGFQ